MKKLISSLICLYALSSGYAQVIINPETLQKQDYTPLQSIGGTFGIGMPAIDNVFMNDGEWNKNKFGIQFSADYRYQFTKRKEINDNTVIFPTMFAIGGGLGFSYYSHDKLEKNNNKTDTLNFSAPYFEVPVYLEIGRPSLTKIKAFGKIGVKPAFKIGGDFTKNTLSENLEPFILRANVSAGVSMPLSSVDKDRLRNTILRIGLKYDFNLMPFTDSERKLHYFGLDISLIYCFKSIQIKKIINAE